MSRPDFVCPRCGKDVPPDSERCPSCGQRVADDAQAAARAAAPGGAGWQPVDQGTAGATLDRTSDAGPDEPGSNPPPRLGGPGSSSEIEGQVRAITSRPRQAGGGGEDIWTFRVERYDDAGNRVLFVPVEMQGYTFEGSLAEGDWVRLRGSLKRGTFLASEVENLTTGATVSAKRAPNAVVVVVGGLFLVLFVAVVVLIVVMVARDSNRSPNGLPNSPVAVAPA